jgi:hypothetical protein
MAWITLALAPICIVLAFGFSAVSQPFRNLDASATGAHRTSVAFLLWPLVLDARKDFDWIKFRRRPKRSRREAAGEVNGGFGQA